MDIQIYKNVFLLSCQVPDTAQWIKFNAKPVQFLKKPMYHILWYDKMFNFLQMHTILCLRGMYVQ